MFAKRNLQTTILPILLLLQLISWTPILSLPQGAPETVCDTLLPFHGGGIPPQTGLPPFRIETSSAVVGQGQTLRVDIVGVPNGLIKFGGYMIQARNRNPPYQIVGQFNPSPDGKSKLMNCANSVNNSATHVNPAPKEFISIEWLTPVDFLGTVVFNATVAQAYDSFWVGIPSEPVQIVRRDLAPTVGSAGFPTRTPYGSTSRAPYRPYYEPDNTQPRAELDELYQNCGSTKTCFGFPDNCVGSNNCNFLAVVTVRGDIYEFELRSGPNSPGYVALGLSNDAKMGDDLVTECVSQNGHVELYTSYTSGSPNFGTSRIDIPQNTARLLNSSLIDGVIYCKVQRDPVTLAKGQNFNLINNNYHLLLASGSSVRENGAGYHDIGRIASANPINLAVVQDIKAASKLLIHLHGAFMVTAWIGTTSLGIIFARYFKQTWVGSQLCGKDQWFAWHRICMVTTWSLTMAAFVIIFVELGAWSGERNPHAILGLITTILCFIQPIGALLRPAPTSKHRPLFNWAHWLGGNLAHILAIITIFFAVKLTKAELPDWVDWILVAYVVFHVLVHIVLSIVNCTADKHEAQRANNTFAMSDMAPHHRNGIKIERKMDAPYSGFRKGLLGFYVVVLILFVVALILCIVLAPIENAFK